MNPGKAGEQISAADYALGIVAGYGEAARWLRKLSGNLFAQGKDMQARIYRGLAEDLEARAELRREDKHKAARAEAFAFLESLDEAIVVTAAETAVVTTT